MLEFHRVSKTYRDVRALRDVSLEVAPGTVVGMVGHNGAGKSTLMRMAVGLVRPDTGRVHLAGVPVERLGRLGGLVAASLDAATLPAQWSAHTAVTVAAGLSGLPVARAREVLELFGLTAAAHKRVGAFSMGMRQRLAIALALIGRPKVLILDEPTNALDPDIAHELRTWIAAHAEAGNAVLISSHNLPEIEQVADRIVVLHQGVVVRDEPTRALLAGGTVLIRVDRPDVLVEQLWHRGSKAEHLADGTLRVTAATTDEVGELAAAGGLVVRELVGERQRLTDAYRRLTADGNSR
ncbi:ABC transporter ATP-binding protein [Virgisporangium aliadipatigenens]|nr:ABC transporter ATP-binding protein [Virgisporangium aliadipatigenens]